MARRKEAREEVPQLCEGYHPQDVSKALNMMNSQHVVIHLPRQTVRRLERKAGKWGITIEDLIISYIAEGSRGGRRG